MGIKPGDFVITKHQWGAFYGTELDLEFRRRGITTNGPARHSDKFRRGKHRAVCLRIRCNQIFAEDTMSALSAEEHKLTVTNIFPHIGLVRKAKEILADLSPD
jgi:nicotinamidase-related amidase